MHCNIGKNHTIFHRHVDHKWCYETPGPWWASETEIKEHANTMPNVLCMSNGLICGYITGIYLCL